MNRKIATLILILPAMTLAGCGGGSSGVLGYGKNPPDEFNVVRRAPLIVPPDFNLLPPAANSSRPASPQGAELARLIVLPNAPKTIIDPTERSLLDKASGGKTYGDGVREELDNQRRGTASEEAILVEQLVVDQSENN